MSHYHPPMFANVRRVFSQLVVYGSGEILLFGISFLLVPIYTRVLTPAEYGILGLLLVLRAFLRPLNQLGLDESFLRFYYDCGDDAARRTLTGTTLAAIGLASGVVLVVLLLAPPRSAACCSAPPSMPGPSGCLP